MKSLWVPVSGAIAKQQQIDTIANNVANMNTPGFKKDSAIFKEHLTALEKGQTINLPIKTWSPENFYQTNGAEYSFVKNDGTYTNFSQGQLVNSNNPLDVAIKGKAFLEVSTPAGNRYTRNGALTLSSDGHLVNSEGFFVLSKDSSGTMNNKDRRIKIPNGKVFINLQGEIYSKGVKISDLSTVEFKDPQLLKKEGNSLYSNADENNISKKNTSSVYQGFTESSNVNSIQEMSDLIKASRQFETLQRVIKTYDSIAGKGINEIAKF